MVMVKKFDLIAWKLSIGLEDWFLLCDTFRCSVC